MTVKNNFLGAVVGLLAFSLPSVPWAQSTAVLQEPVIQPQVDRREIKVPKIDVDDFEFGVYTGVLSVEDFGSDTVIGARLGYHLTEDFFVEVAGAQSQVSDTQYRALLPSGVFPEETVDFKYWLMSVGYNLLPGEVFFGDGYAFGSGVYLIAGVGNVRFADVSTTAFSFGLGVRALPTDWLSLRVEMRDHIFEQDVIGRNKQTHNFELTFGMSVYF